MAVEKNFNPRSPCGERQRRPRPKGRQVRFQSTLPVWGATWWRWNQPPCRKQFQSTLPVWGATRSCLYSIGNHRFQSTLPVWGATGLPSLILANVRDFNPRSPCGERPGKSFSELMAGGFQSTLPVWGATSLFGYVEISLIISIHAPRVGSDLSWPSSKSNSSNFNPRSPCGERLVPPAPVFGSTDFNPRSPCGERLFRTTV